ncbi:GNAT family N-acetyltransferase [Rhodococcus sp. UNC363MFTsu5.1]|uniref:GNAT family N-acetyltransferase n=1 Tax=Rhodococcus sp. UNC363MFTsu5.1 TaxID=1449069 RepID=UPI00055DA7CE|nr:GNAT family N-acetyltransferase [Rhodococcus sp. UNC363MFTsu5.1]
MIRSATTTDLVHLPAIEIAAGLPFRSVGMDAVADDDPPTVRELAEYQRAGRAWVATTEDDVPIGYALALAVDGAAHLEQVSVDPAHAGRRLGAALIDEVERWAAERKYPWLTLTTFAQVPWNAPYYERLGFRVVPADELTPGLRSIREHEADRGLDAWPRVTMRRIVGSALPPSPGRRDTD